MNAARSGSWTIASAVMATALGLVIGTTRDAAEPQTADAQERAPIDVVVLVDDSNCLAGASLNGINAKAAIIEGIGRVADRLDPLGGDRIGLVLYNDSALIAMPLTQDPAALIEAADRIRQRDNNARLDRGFQQAQQAFAEGHRENAIRATINITDGPMMPAPELARTYGDRLREELGVRHYSIAVGTLVQFSLLRLISEPDGVYEVPFGGDVITYYERFAETVLALAEAGDVIEVPTPEPRPTVWADALQTYLPWVSPGISR